MWRLAISQPHDAADSVQSRLNTRPDTTTLQPESIDLFTGGEVRIDRVIWFAAQRPSPTTYEFGQIFWNYLGQTGMPTWLAGKQYAVVGPRPKTVIGSSRPATGQGVVQSNRVISLDNGPLPQGNTVHVVPDYPQVNRAFGLGPGVIQPAMGIVAAMDPPAADNPRTPWNQIGETAPYGIGVSISEPLPGGQYYYPEPDHRINQPQRFPFQDAYAIANSSADKFPDQPYDQRDGRPLKELGLLGEGTRQDLCTVFLQHWLIRCCPGTRRLKWRIVDSLGRPLFDPNLPVNPYITVDWLPVDLTVFNGDDRQPLNWDNEKNETPWNFPQMQFNPDDQPGEFRFATRERGDEQSRIPNLFTWAVPPELPETVVDPTVDSNDYFRDRLLHTLGFLNRTYRTNQGAAVAPWWRTTGDSRYVGDPLVPFPWLTWNNRPYANQMELLLVPATSPQRLLLEFSTDTRKDPYRGGLDNLRAPFYHLLNFYHSSVPGTASVSERSPNLHRLLELVEVPSRFAGTQRWYNPMSFAMRNGESMEGNPKSTLQPPFNTVSRFRDPGRVNINTIFDPRVWQAITDGFGATVTWQELEESRRGYDVANKARFPTEFANPFRSSLGADLQFTLLWPGPDPVEAGRPEDVQATLLRRDAGLPTSSDPLFEYKSIQPYEDTSNNPYFRYELLRRLGNTVTTQSNVYAVWITVGYFEVEPQTGLLGQELNADTGNVSRHRAFYIIDRSIPVAYEPGENHNVDRAVQLRRFIE